MTALSAAKRRQIKAPGTLEVFTVGTGAVLYQGALVALNVSTRRAVAGTNAASRHFLGVATETKTGNTAGTVSVVVEYGQIEQFVAGTGLTGGYAGGTVYVRDSATVTYATGAGTAGVRVSVGRLVKFEDASNVWVAIARPAAGTGLASL